jgi:hypothetical protein
MNADILGARYFLGRWRSSVIGFGALELRSVRSGKVKM